MVRTSVTLLLATVLVGPKWPPLIVLVLDRFSVFFPSWIKGVCLVRAHSAAGTYPEAKLFFERHADAARNVAKPDAERRTLNAVFSTFHVFRDPCILKGCSDASSLPDLSSREPW